VDRQLVGREDKVLHGDCIVSVDRQLVGGEDNVLHGECNVSVDRKVIGGEVKFCMARLLRVWIDSLLVEK
jgi:hypothetical protein